MTAHSWMDGYADDDQDTIATERYDVWDDAHVTDLAELVATPAPSAAVRTAWGSWTAPPVRPALARADTVAGIEIEVAVAALAAGAWLGVVAMLAIAALVAVAT